MTSQSLVSNLKSLQAAFNAGQENVYTINQRVNSIRSLLDLLAEQAGRDNETIEKIHMQLNDIESCVGNVFSLK